MFCKSPADQDVALLSRSYIMMQEHHICHPEISAHLMTDRLCTKADLGQASSQHRECLATARLPIRKDARIVA